MEISSIINTFSSDYLPPREYFILSPSLGTVLPQLPIGIPNAEFIVVPQIFKATTPVGARSITRSFPIFLP